MATETKKNFTTSELHRIMSSCVTCGVSKFRFGDLQLEFREQATPAAKTTITPSTQVSVPEMTDDDHQKRSDESHVQSEIATREEQISQMVIENPQLAEELIQDGDLEDDGSEHRDDAGIPAEA